METALGIEMDCYRGTKTTPSTFFIVSHDDSLKTKKT